MISQKEGLCIPDDDRSASSEDCASSVCRVGLNRMSFERAIALDLGSSFLSLPCRQNLNYCTWEFIPNFSCLSSADCVRVLWHPASCLRNRVRSPESQYADDSRLFHPVTKLVTSGATTKRQNNVYSTVYSSTVQDNLYLEL